MYCFNILLLIQCLCQMCVRCLSMLLIFAVYVWHCKLNRSNSQLQRCRPLLDHCGHVARSACTAASPRARTLHCTAVRRSSLKRACAHSHWWCWTGAHSALAEPVINWDRLCCGSRVTLARVRTSASALITSASGREQRDDWPRENADGLLLGLNRCQSASADVIGRVRRHVTISTTITLKKINNYSLIRIKN